MLKRRCLLSDLIVWTGGVSQERKLETAALGLALMYPAYQWSVQQLLVANSHYRLQHNCLLWRKGRRVIWVKGGTVLAFSEKTAFGSRSRLGAHGITRKPPCPLSTLLRRMPSAARNARFETVLSRLGPRQQAELQSSRDRTLSF